MAIEWMKKIRETPGAQVMMKNVVKVWMCQVVLEFIYPPYYYIFTTLSDRGQMIFALLLPVIKLIMRNTFIRTVVHLSDEMPEVVVFNVEVFNALFMSLCMQNSPSVWTTLELMLVNITLIVLSLHDVEAIRFGLKDLERRIDREKGWNRVDTVGCTLTTLNRTRILLEQQMSTRGSQVIRRPGKSKVLVVPLVDTMQSFHSAVGPDPIPGRVATCSQLRHSAKVHPALESVNLSLQKFSVNVRYTRKVQRLLYITEFLLLLNYVEVVIPLVFSIYMIATYHLPNHEYYAQLHDITQGQLIQTLENVMFYCSLQIVSLLLLVFVLQHKLGLSPMHQLAFVLEKQYSGVQTRLVFWVFYNVQASLQHNGYDYTFQFSWLSSTNKRW